MPDRVFNIFVMFFFFVVSFDRKGISLSSRLGVCFSIYSGA